MIKKVSTLATTKKKTPKRRYSQGRPTLDDLEQRKSRVLEIATALFVEQGFAETSLVEIAKHAGVATRTIYQHFGNKEDIFKIVLDQRMAETDGGLPTINEDQHLFGVLMDTAHYVCALAVGGNAIPFQRLMVAESQRFPDLMLEIFEMLFHRLHNRIISVFENLTAKGMIPDGNHSVTTKYFIDLLLGTAPLQLTMNWVSEGPSENELQEKVELFIAGRFGLVPEREPAPELHQA
ncbi:TetR/AcrR family transcriptional regulator [Zhongshania sp.]|uniref:TetR/AcrR family transcriptional regulator n=1 Tax=Zhongshania sp. TaxID=1971902 RepID=UPI00356137B2